MSSLNHNLSHRYLIKQKTKELFYYPIHTNKTTNNIKSKHVLTDVSLTSNRKQLVEPETSINLDDQLETSLGGKVRSASAGGIDGKKILLKGQRIQFGLRRSSQGKTKSTQAIPKLKSPTPKLRPSFSLKKYRKPRSTPTPTQKTSSTSTQPPRCQQKYKKTIKNENENASETKLQTKNLKKTSTIRMKQNIRSNGIKVIDPFEKRRKLDMEFQDESIINKNINNQSLFMDTWNKKEFMDLLHDIV